MRSFTLSDRKRLEFRVSSDNIANHVNYSSIATVVNALNYGLPTATGPDAHDEHPSEVPVLMRWLSLFPREWRRSAQQEYTFKSATNLVVVNVIVRDKKGAIIEGLKPEQFTLLENGKPQTISVFEFQRLTSEKANACKASPRRRRPSRPQVRFATATAGCWYCSSILRACRYRTRSVRKNRL